MEQYVAPRKPYPTDVNDDAWAFVAPYLTLLRDDAPQRVHDLREVCNALRWIVQTGPPWRYLPDVVAGLHVAAFDTVMLHRLGHVVAQRP